MATQREKYNKWSWWIAILAAILLLLMWIFGCGGKVCCGKNAAPVSASFNAGKVALAGAVASEADRDALVSALGNRYGVANLTTDLAVDDELGAGAEQTLVLRGSVESREVAGQMIAELKEKLPNFKFIDKLSVIAAPITDASKVQCGGNSLALAIRFDTGSAALQGNDTALLDAAAPCIKETFEIQGHTDSEGEYQMNMALSQDRANSVRDYLVSKGVAENLLVTRAFGETQPIASNQSEFGRSLNRRIELVSLK